jgi:hypothetical protein
MIGRDPPFTRVSAMLKDNVLRVSILLALLIPSGAFGAERVRMAQAGQTVTPVPAPPPSLSLATTSCQISCDTQAMNCMNNCGLITGAQATAAPDFRVQCSLGCSSQQLVCKQGC